jgi:UDP-N-acetylmuramate dehydrogenase
MINIQKNIKLSDYSTLKIGGPAREFVSVKNENDLIEAVSYAKKSKMKFLVVGGGSNILFDDKGYGGLIIKMEKGDGEIKISESKKDLKAGESFGHNKAKYLNIWAGESLSSIVEFSKQKELSGLEWAIGIPGTIGGAVSGNAGAFGFSMEDFVESVSVFKVFRGDFPMPDKKTGYTNRECRFEYRSSRFKENQETIILSVKIKLFPGDKEEISEKIRENIKKREEKQPKGWFGSAGSFFKNPIVENKLILQKFESEKNIQCVDKRIPAGWLIEEAGLKGKKFGNILISEANANFIINEGKGTAEEIIIVAGIIKQKIRNKFGIQLKEEVRIVFDN